MMKQFLLTTALVFGASAALAMDATCADGKTLNEGVLTIATSNPAYSPWVLNNDPAAGEGFEAALAYAVAEKLGFDAEAVEWVSASFDQSIQPGPKDFDFNLQQFSITPERDAVVDFSEPYYDAAMAIVALQSSVDGGMTTDMDALKELRWGVHAATTAPKALDNLISPEKSPLLYDDTADVLEAMKAGQIDASLFDLPTALYVTAVLLENSVIIGQFPAGSTEIPDQFGLLMSEGSELKLCIDEAIMALKDEGTLAEIQAKWLSDETGIPVIE